MLRRLPGVVFLYRYRAISALVFLALLLVALRHSRGVCDDAAVISAVEQLCWDYSSGNVLGTFCESLCHREVSPTSHTCIPGHSGKNLVFSTTWDDQIVYVKSAYSSHLRDNYYSSHLPPMTEEIFRSAIGHLVENKLNITISSQQLESLLRLTPRSATQAAETRQLEMQQVFSLSQSQEYLLSVLFSDQEVFPRVLGTCGHLYVLEPLTAPELDAYFFDGKRDWSERLKLAVLIMEFLEQLDTEFPDPLRICDVKWEHFGLTSLGRLKYLDGDAVHTDNVLQRMTSDGRRCSRHEQCDLFDCKAVCNVRTNRCDLGVSNNNLQIVCEKIFLGWKIPGKLIVPGLLMTDYTPTALASLLRQCADTGRAAVPEDIRQRLYTTLTEIEQIMSEQLS